MERTNNNIKEKWHAIRLIINRKKIEQHNCVVPNTVVGQMHDVAVQHSLIHRNDAIQRLRIQGIRSHFEQKRDGLMDETDSLNVI